MNDQEQQLNVLAQAMVQLQQLAQASEQGDQQAQAIMQEVQKRAQAMVQQAQQPAMAKCGTKLKKKGELGLKVKKAECRCKTKLKKVGGKLVTVDCSGNIIKAHQIGGIIMPPIVMAPTARYQVPEQIPQQVQQQADSVTQNENPWLNKFKQVVGPYWNKGKEAIRKYNEKRAQEQKEWMKYQYWNNNSPYFQDPRFSDAANEL